MSRSEDREPGPAALPDPGLPLTDCARRCLRRAQVIAWHLGVEVSSNLVLMCLVLDPQEASRARLTLRMVGPFYEVEDNIRSFIERAEEYLDRDGSAAAWEPDVKTMVARLAYWAERTGDRHIDTAHLLLACLESSALDTAEAISFVKVSVHDVIRMAMSERYHVAESDRQRIGVAPILSRDRPDRPVADPFPAPPPTKALLRPGNYLWRSWHAGSEHMNSFILQRVTRAQLWLVVVQQLLLAAAFAAVAYAIFFVNAWSAAALVPLFTIAMYTPIPARVTADAGLIALSVWQHLPWWLAAAIVLYHGVDQLAGRFALLSVRSDAADPAVTDQDLRSDVRTNLVLSMFHRLDALPDRTRRT